MANNTLNERQEKFCQEIMQGKTQRQAYYSVYPSSLKWKSESVDIQASKLINLPKVCLRLQELRASAAEDSKITRNDLIEQLKSIGFADLDLDNIRPTDKIKAIEVMVKILGYDKPEPPTDSTQGVIPALLEALNEVRQDVK